jgi:hypothetical protein
MNTYLKQIFEKISKSIKIIDLLRYVLRQSLAGLKNDVSLRKVGTVEDFWYSCEN